jgi:hypothetical protein
MWLILVLFDDSFCSRIVKYLYTRDVSRFLTSRLVSRDGCDGWFLFIFYYCNVACFIKFPVSRELVHLEVKPLGKLLFSQQEWNTFRLGM